MLSLKITRDAILWDHAYGLTIFVDGKKIGKICGNETRRFTIPKDSKVIYGKMYWGAKTRSYELNETINNSHLLFRKYATSNPLVIFGIIGYPLEIVEKSHS